DVGSERYPGDRRLHSYGRRSTMTMYRVTKNDVETFTIVTNPKREFASSSVGGATGSIYVFPRHSNIEKELGRLPAFLDTSHNEDDLEDDLSAIQKVGRVIRNSPSVAEVHSASFHSMLSGYLDKVNAKSTSARKLSTLEITRFTPTTRLTEH